MLGVESEDWLLMLLVMGLGLGAGRGSGVGMRVPLIDVSVSVRGGWAMSHTVEKQQWLVVVLSLRGVLGTVPIVVTMALNGWLLFLVYSSDGGDTGDAVSLRVTVVCIRGFSSDNSGSWCDGFG